MRMPEIVARRKGGFCMVPECEEARTIGTFCKSHAAHISDSLMVKIVAGPRDKAWRKLTHKAAVNVSLALGIESVRAWFSSEMFGDPEALFDMDKRRITRKGRTKRR